MNQEQGRLSVMIKETLAKHKAKVEVLQWAIMSAIGSLIYTEYLSCFRQSDKPIYHVDVPPLSAIREFLSEESYSFSTSPNRMIYMQELSNELIDRMSKDDFMKAYIPDAPELELFKERNIEVTKAIFDLYMMPNIMRRIPEAIGKKFGLVTPGDQERKDFTFRENRDLEQAFFEKIRKGYASMNDLVRYTANEAVLQLLLLVPSIERETTAPEYLGKFRLERDNIMVINNQNSITPIAIDFGIIGIQPVFETIAFVADLEITDTDKVVIFGKHEKNEVKAKCNSMLRGVTFKTNPLNSVLITELGYVNVEKGLQNNVKEEDIKQPEPMQSNISLDKVGPEPTSSSVNQFTSPFNERR